MNHIVLKHPRTVKWLAPLLSVTLLSACGTLDRKDGPAYQQARQTQALELPPDLSSPGGRTGIPDIVAAEATAGDLQGFERFRQFEQWEEFEQYRQWKEQAASGEKLDFQAFLEARQAARQGGTEGGGVTIVRNVDESRDIRIEGVGGDTAFQYVDSALQAMNIEILERLPDRYEFTVVLPELGESSLFRRKEDQFTLEIGRDQQDMIVALTDRRNDRVISEPAREFLNRLAGQLRVAKTRIDLENRVTTSGLQIGTLRTVESGHLELDLEGDPGRVWDRLDFAIDQIGFTVLERKREDHTFKFRFVTDDQIPPERTGLAKLAFWKGDEGSPEGSDVYSVRIEPNPQGSTVRVLDHNGQSSETGDTILELLRESL